MKNNSLEKRNKELKSKGQIHSGAELVNGRIQISKSVRLLIVGHFPGEEEYAVGEPFIGPAGKNILHLISLVRHDWFKLHQHPFSSGQAELAKGLWQQLFGGKIAIFNWRYGKAVEKKSKKGTVTKIVAGDRVINPKVRLEEFRLKLASNSKIPILVLGKIPRTDLVGGKDELDAGEISKEGGGDTFFWFHPDPRNTASGLFWGTSNRANGGFKELLKFLKEIK